MPLTRNQVQIGSVVFEALPFNWPRSNWELLEVDTNDETGWRDLDDTAIAALRALYNGAHGAVEVGLSGFVVQQLAGTGSTPFIVSDWRGNTASYVFVPDTGLVIKEIHGASDTGTSSGRYTVSCKLVKVG